MQSHKEILTNQSLPQPGAAIGKSNWPTCGALRFAERQVVASLALVMRDDCASMTICHNSLECCTWSAPVAMHYSKGLPLSTLSQTFCQVFQTHLLLQRTVTRSQRHQKQPAVFLLVQTQPAAGEQRCLSSPDSMYPPAETGQDTGRLSQHGDGIHGEQGGRRFDRHKQRGRVRFTPKMISAPTGTDVARIGTSSSSSSPSGNLTKVPLVLRSST